MYAYRILQDCLLGKKKNKQTNKQTKNKKQKTKCVSSSSSENCYARCIFKIFHFINRTRILRFSAYALAIFTEYTAWAAFGGRKLEVT